VAVSDLRCSITRRPASVVRVLLWTLILTLACARVAAQAWECPWQQGEIQGTDSATNDCLLHCLGDKSPAPALSHALPGPAEGIALPVGQWLAWPSLQWATRATHEHLSTLWLSTRRLRL
jgi:hypothetical protein